MTEEGRDKGHGLPVGGVILLFFGVIFLLQTTHVLPWSLWGTLWRFWPLLLIVAGVGMLLRRINSWLVGLIVLVILFAALGIAVLMHGPGMPVKTITSDTYSQSKDGLAQASISMDLNVGDITLGPLAPGSFQLVEVGFSGENKYTVLNADFSRDGDEGFVRMETDRSDWTGWFSDEKDFMARFSPDIPLTMDIECAASEMNADFSDLQVTALSMQLAVGDYDIVLPGSVKDGTVYMDANLSDVKVAIPRGVAARITVDDNLSGVDIDESRFPRSGDSYTSRDYDTAFYRLDMDIDCNLGHVEVR